MSYYYKLHKKTFDVNAECWYNYNITVYILKVFRKGLLACDWTGLYVIIHVPLQFKLVNPY